MTTWSAAPGREGMEPRLLGCMFCGAAGEFGGCQNDKHDRVDDEQEAVVCADHSEQLHDEGSAGGSQVTSDQDQMGAGRNFFFRQFFGQTIEEDGCQKTIAVAAADCSEEDDRQAASKGEKQVAQGVEEDSHGEHIALHPILESAVEDASYDADCLKDCQNHGSGLVRAKPSVDNHVRKAQGSGCIYKYKECSHQEACGKEGRLAGPGGRRLRCCPIRVSLSCTEFHFSVHAGANITLGVSQFSG